MKMCFKYLLILYIICSFVTLLGFINGNIKLYRKNKKILSPFVISVFSILFPVVWYMLYLDLKAKKLRNKEIK